MTPVHRFDRSILQSPRFRSHKVLRDLPVNEVGEPTYPLAVGVIEALQTYNYVVSESKSDTKKKEMVYNLLCGTSNRASLPLEDLPRSSRASSRVSSHAFSLENLPRSSRASSHASSHARSPAVASLSQSSLASSRPHHMTPGAVAPSLVPSDPASLPSHVGDRDLRPSSADADRLEPAGSANMTMVLGKLEDLATKMAGLQEQMGRVETRLGGVENRLGEVENRLGQVENRLGQVENRLGQVENRLGQVENRLGEVENRLGEVEGQVSFLGARLTNRALSDSRLHMKVLANSKGELPPADLRQMLRTKDDIMKMSLADIRRALRHYDCAPPGRLTAATKLSWARFLLFTLGGTREVHLEP